MLALRLAALKATHSFGGHRAIFGPVQIFLKSKSMLMTQQREFIPAVISATSLTGVPVDVADKPDAAGAHAASSTSPHPPTFFPDFPPFPPPLPPPRPPLPPLPPVPPIPPLPQPQTKLKSTTLQNLELPDLEIVMQWDMHDQRLRFDQQFYQNKFGESIDQKLLDQVEKECKRWLYICGTHPNEIFSLGTAELIDEFWHQMMLFTKQYHEFCMEIFGHYIHHEPCGEGFKTQTPGMDDAKVYQNFLSIYKKTFGEEAPVELWPRDLLQGPACGNGGCGGGGGGGLCAKCNKCGLCFRCGGRCGKCMRG